MTGDRLTPISVRSGSRLAGETLCALLALRCACKLCVQVLPEEELVRQLEARPRPAPPAERAAPPPPAPAQTSQLETLLAGLLEVLVDVPLT